MNQINHSQHINHQNQMEEQNLTGDIKNIISSLKNVNKIPNIPTNTINQLIEKSQEMLQNFNFETFREFLMHFIYAKQQGVYLPNIEDEIENIQKDLIIKDIDELSKETMYTKRAYAYQQLSDRISEALSLGLTIPQIQTQRIEMEDSVIKNELDISYQKLQNKLRELELYEFEKWLRIAKTIGLDVQKYEEQLPALVEQAFQNEIETIIYDFEKNPTDNIYKKLSYKISNATKRGIDFSNIQKIRISMENQVIREQVKTVLKEINERKRKPSLKPLKKLIKKAAIGGIYIEDLLPSFQKIQKEVYINEIQIAKSELEKEYRLNKLIKLEEVLKEAQSKGVDTSEFEEELDRLTKITHRSEVIVTLNWIEKEPLPEYYYLIVEEIEKAKLIGAYVDDIQEKLKEIESIIFFSRNQIIGHYET
ncbi:hypothetical protein HLG78_01085 [Candidatus Absconditicoccus praedator]|nr:hypothetical protein HLG78_01085 [Candidatus Absconditicoccus praedator]